MDQEFELEDCQKHLSYTTKSLFSLPTKAVCATVERWEGVSRKVVLATKVFRVATGINPVISVALATVGSVVDNASLIYSSYKIHKKSDSSAAKELAKVRDQLEESRKQSINMKECLSDIFNSM